MAGGGWGRLAPAETRDTWEVALPWASLPLLSARGQWAEISALKQSICSWPQRETRLAVVSGRKELSKAQAWAWVSGRALVGRSLTLSFSKEVLLSLHGPHLGEDNGVFEVVVTEVEIKRQCR